MERREDDPRVRGPYRAAAGSCYRNLARTGPRLVEVTPRRRRGSGIRRIRKPAVVGRFVPPYHALRGDPRTASTAQDREATVYGRALLRGALDTPVALTFHDALGRTATRRLARVSRLSFATRNAGVHNATSCRDASD